VSKAELLKKVIARMADDLNLMRRAATEARDSVIHPDAKQEGKYDTRAIEASYLAGAQAERAAELERIIGKLQMLSVSQPSKTVNLGSLVVAEIDGHEGRFFIVPEGGGLSVEHERHKVQVIASHSPLGQALVGRAAEDEFEFEAGGRKKSVLIVSFG
jgi:transcription elongation GreA/GreB family factor